MQGDGALASPGEGGAEGRQEGETEGGTEGRQAGETEGETEERREGGDDGAGGSRGTPIPGGELSGGELRPTGSTHSTVGSIALRELEGLLARHVGRGVALEAGSRCVHLLLLLLYDSQPRDE